MYVNDFDLNGRVEQVICSYSSDTLYPVVLKDDLISQIPVLASRYQRYSDYAGQTMQDIFDPETLERSIVLTASVLESCVMINEGGSSLRLEKLPVQAQYAPVFAMLAEDLDGDGKCDLVLGGNQSRAKPQTGTYTASYGLFLKGEGNGKFHVIPPWLSGISVRGDIRDLKILESNGNRVLVVVRNNDILRFLKLEG
jgi:hypothetical protein